MIPSDMKLEAQPEHLKLVHGYPSDLSCRPSAFPMRKTRRTVKGLKIVAFSDELWEIMG